MQSQPATQWREDSDMEVTPKRENGFNSELLDRGWHGPNNEVVLKIEATIIATCGALLRLQPSSVFAVTSALW